MKSVAIRFCAVVAVAGVLVGVASVVPSRVPAAGRPPTRVALERATLVCPESSFARGVSSTDVGAISALTESDIPGRPSGRRVAPKLDIAPLGETETLASGDRRQQAVSYSIRAPEVPPLVVAARGDLAPGVTAGQLTRTDEGPLRGLAEVLCVPPASEFWFVGAGSEVGRHGRVYLTNADEGTAHVDLLLFDEKGPVAAETGRGLAIKGGSQMVVELDRLAPTSKRLAVAVRTRQGRVTAALRDDAVKGETPLGVDWIPAAVAPARDVLVPGIAPGSGERILSIVAPGDSTANVEVTILSPQGSFRPADVERVEVKPGTVAQVRLDDVTQKQPAAVRLTSDVPVTASVRSVFGASDGPRDVVHVGATRAVAGAAVVPLTLGGSRRSATVLLSTTSQRSVDATTTLYALDGRPLDKTETTVRPGSTVAVKLTAPARGKHYVITVRADSGGPLYGARLLVEDAPDGPMASAWPLFSGATTAVRPVARPDPTAGIGSEEPRDAIFD
jgi:hypothetical protein